MKSRLLFLLTLTSLVVSGCSHIKFEKPIEKDEYELVDEFLGETPVTFSNDIDTTPLTIDSGNPYTELTQSVYDFAPIKQANAVLSFTIVDKNADYNPPATPVSSINITQEDVAFYDNYNETYPFTSFNGGYGIATLTISPTVFSNVRRVYYLELKNDNLIFRGKDDGIRRLTFYTMNRGATGSEVEYNEDISYLEPAKVYYYDEDGYSPYFVYSEDPGLANGVTFRIRDPEIDKDNKDTLYGKIKSIQKNPNGAGYMVRYIPAKGDDVFKKLNVNESFRLDDTGFKPFDIGEMQQNVANGILHNPNMVTTMYGLLNAFHKDVRALGKGVIDWGTHIDIKINTNYDFNTEAFTLAITAAYTFYPEDHLTVTLQFGYKQTWTYDVSASVAIETAFIVPVGIDYTLKVVEDTQKEISFGILVSYDWAGEYDENRVKEECEAAIMNAYNSRSDWQKRSVFNGSGSTNTPGGTSYPIFEIACTALLPFEIYFAVNFYWEIIPTVEAVVKYASHTQRVDLCVSNEGGADPSSDSATKTTSSLSFTFMGKVHLEVGIRLALGIDVVGLYRFFHAEVFIDAYGAVDIQGYLYVDISWDEDQPVTPNLSMACKFEISVGLKVGVDIYLLFGGYTHEWPIVAVPLFGMQVSSPFQEFVEDASEMYVNEHDYDASKKQFNLSIGDRHLLAARTFNSESLLVEIKDIQYNDKEKAIYGAFVPEDVMFDYFYAFDPSKDVEVLSGELKSQLTLSEDGHVMLETLDNQDNFTAVLTVRVAKQVSLGSEPTKTITVHFTNNNRQEVTVDGKDFGSFVQGAVIQLPVPDPIKYKKFTGYSYKDKDGNTQYIVYDEDPSDPSVDPMDSLKYAVETYEETFMSIEFTSTWIDYYHWEVIFLDGFNNLIKKEMVLNGEDATAPGDAKRDFYMNNNPPDANHHYEFVGYDREFTNITGPTVVRALYKIVHN